MIQILPCPGCGRSHLLPPDISLEALIECPDCGSEMILGEALSLQFGSWKVVNDPAVVAALQACSQENVSALDESPYSVTALPSSTSSATVSGAPNSVDASGHDGAENDSAMVGSEVAAETAPQKPKPNWSEFKPITHEQYQRMKRKSGSPIWSIVQVVLGGIAAVPIALLLLWYVLGKDVAGAGPFVGRYVPWIVPERFRPVDQDSTFPSRPALSRGSGGLPSVSGDVRSGNERANDAGDRPQVGGDTDGSAAVDALEMRHATDTKDAIVGEASPTGNANVGDSTGVEGKEQLDPSADSQSIAPVSQNIFLLIQNCEQELDLWRAAVLSGDGELRPIAQAIYHSLIDLASVVNEFPRESAVLRSVRDALQPIARNIKRNEDLQNVVKQGANYWIKTHAESEAYGLAAIVELVEVTEEFEYWILKAVLPEEFSNEFGAILVPRDITPSLIPGQKLLLFGRVQEPKDHDEQAPSGRTFVASYLHAL